MTRPITRVAVLASALVLAGCGPHASSSPSSASSPGSSAAALSAAPAATSAASLAATAAPGSSTAPSTPAGTSAGPSPTTSGVTPGTGLAAFYAARADWKPCTASFAAVDFVNLSGLQCATVAVPLDYRHPGGRQIAIGVARLPALRGHPIGSLVLNFGGPGESGLADLAGAGSVFSSAVRDHFDLISFDPRGVGVSAGLNCLPEAQVDQRVAAPPVPADPAQVAQAVALAKLLADGCRRTAGWELPYLGTTYSARDLDLIRSAVGDAKLSYLGFSYGTELGAVYADEFPTNVRALVLDGALPPGLGVPAQAQEQANGFEGELRDFLANCVTSSGCPWSGTPADARSGLDALLAKVSASPLRTTSSRQLHIGEAVAGVSRALYFTELWPTLRSALAGAERGDGSSLLVLSDQQSGRQPSGYESFSSAFPAIFCADTPAAYTVQQASAYARQWAVAAPLFGPVEAWSLLTCDGWETTATPLPDRVTGQGAPPIVVVGTTGDPATPYAWAQDLAGQLTSARLVTYNGDGHTAYLTSGSTCVVDAVNTYLVDLTPPAVGLQCH